MFLLGYILTYPLQWTHCVVYGRGTNVFDTEKCRKENIFDVYSLPRFVPSNRRLYPAITIADFLSSGG
jgi:hypothetical protein